MKIGPKWSHFLFVNESNITTTKQKGGAWFWNGKSFLQTTSGANFLFFPSSLPHKWQIESKNPLCKHNFLLFVDQIYLLFGVIISKKEGLFAFLINY